MFPKKIKMGRKGMIATKAAKGGIVESFNQSMASKPDTNSMMEHGPIVNNAKVPAGTSIGTMTKSMNRQFASQPESYGDVDHGVRRTISGTDKQPDPSNSPKINSAQSRTDSGKTVSYGDESNGPSMSGKGAPAKGASAIEAARKSANQGNLTPTSMEQNGSRLRAAKGGKVAAAFGGRKPFGGGGARMPRLTSRQPSMLGGSTAAPAQSKGFGFRPMAAQGGRMALGGGGRFAALKAKLAKRPGVTDPGALAGAIGRKKYGAAKMGQMAAAGRRRSESGR